MASEGPPSVQVVDGAGKFNLSGLEAFVKGLKLSECGLSYAVVAIMGPQSSGKSTLLNHLFRTHFVEMDAFRGRSQTTQGIWMAPAVDIEPCTLVCDLEGSDSRERGEDDTAFEKQSSLFALAVADVVLINMWCHDIGREHAANKPLLKTVFQVMMRLFTPRKTTLLFVVRDKTKTPLERLEPILREDVQKIWETVTKPQQYTTTPLSEFFNIEVTALSSFEEKEEQFNEEVAVLRERFQNSIAPGRIAGDRRGVVPGTGFPISTQEIWRVIKENKDLDLPAHKVMVATVRCEEIVKEKIEELAASEAWRALDEGAREGVVTGFGKQASALLHQCFAGYDSEAAFFDEGVRGSKRQDLLAKVRELLHPAYVATLGHHRGAALDKLKADLDAFTGGKDGSAAAFAVTAQELVEEALAQFDAGAADANVPEMDWDAAKMREKLKRDIDAHVATVKAEKLQVVANDAEKYFSSALGDPVGSLLDAATPRTWLQIRAVFAKESATARESLAAAISGYELGEASAEKMQAALLAAGRAAIEKRTREEAAQVLMHMKDRFNTVFSRDADAMPRRWTGREDLRSITREARAAALQLLSVLAAVRLEDEAEDSIEATLLGLLGDSEGGGASAGAAAAEEAPVPDTQLNGSIVASAWAKVSAADTVLSPPQCRALWRQFKSETEYTISQAMQAQDASRRSNSWLPPPWAILAMVVLGFNEAVALVRNPMLLMALVVIYFLLRALWVQLDAGAEFNNGLVPGLLATSAKLVPTMMNIFKRLIEEGQAQLHHQQQHHTRQNASHTPPRKEIQMQDFVSGGDERPMARGVTEDSMRQRAPPMGPAL